MDPSDFPAPRQGFVLTHSFTVADPRRSGRFYADVLGGKVVMDGQPTIVKVANSWIILNVGGGPTKDKPDVVLAPPSDPRKVQSFLNIRVADIQAAYKEWTAQGATFLTPPQDHHRGGPAQAGRDVSR